MHRFTLPAVLLQDFFFFLLFNMQHTHKGPFLTYTGWRGGWEVGGWGYVYVLCVIQQPGFERVYRDCG